MCEMVHPRGCAYDVAMLDVQELLAMQQNGPKDIGFFGTRNMGFMHQQLIEVLSYAMVLTVSAVPVMQWLIMRMSMCQSHFLVIQRNDVGYGKVFSASRASDGIPHFAAWCHEYGTFSGTFRC